MRSTFPARTFGHHVCERGSVDEGIPLLGSMQRGHQLAENTFILLNIYSPTVAALSDIGRKQRMMCWAENCIDVCVRQATEEAASSIVCLFSSAQCPIFLRQAVSAHLLSLSLSLSLPPTLPHPTFLLLLKDLTAVSYGETVKFYPHARPRRDE